MRNQDLYLDFEANPALAEALANQNPGDKVKLELTVLIKSKDERGLSAVVEPGTIVPEGYEQEPGNDQDTPQRVPQPQAGTNAVMPVTVAMGLKKKDQP